MWFINESDGSSIILHDLNPCVLEEALFAVRQDWDRSRARGTCSKNQVELQSYYKILNEQVYKSC